MPLVKLQSAKHVVKYVKWSNGRFYFLLLEFYRCISLNGEKEESNNLVY